MSIGNAISAVGLGASLLDKGPKMKQQPQSGFQTWEPEIQDFYMDDYFPRVQDEFSRPYQSIPMKRATTIYDGGFDPMFDSYGMSDWQVWSDMQDGYFSPLDSYLNEQPDAGPSQAEIADLVAAEMGNINRAQNWLGSEQMVSPSVNMGPSGQYQLNPVHYGVNDDGTRKSIGMADLGRIGGVLEKGPARAGSEDDYSRYIDILSTLGEI